MNNVKQKLKELNMTQIQAASISEISLPSFNLICNNKIVVYPAWKKRIAKALDTKEEELFD